MSESRVFAKDNKVTINVPISKSNIDMERRIVSGWATIDNLDQGGDLVTAEASLIAFQEFRGNIREQHDQNKAVGKLVNFRQQEYFSKDGMPHTGIWVDVYISKGAPDTWEKVLDGTLSGFSIGGAYPDSGVTKEYIPDHNTIANIITYYKLLELSLVDNPGNELCDVVAVQKSVDGEQSVLVADVNVQNVFWCDDDQVAFLSSNDLIKCNSCGSEITSVGWFELIEGEDQANEIKKILDGKLSEELSVTKGGSETMPEENVEQEVVAEAEEVQEDTSEVQANEVEDVKEVDDSDETSEVAETVEPDFAVLTKALESIQQSLDRATASEQERENAISKVIETVEGVEAKVAGQLEKLLQEHQTLASDFESFKQGLKGIEKRLENVEGTTAIQKSLTVEGVAHPTEREGRSFWKGTFLD